MGATLSLLDLDRDYPEIERLPASGQWPFLRSDLEVSHRQPGATAFVARKEGSFGGFFLTHTFGHVGYLDMMITAREVRKRGVARPLYFRTVRELKRKGVRSFVVHTTNDSARLIRLLGFRPGRSFTLLARDPGAAEAPGELVDAPPARRAEVVELDREAFGMARPEWINALLREPSTRCRGLEREGRLVVMALATSVLSALALGRLTVRGIPAEG
jgi:hypothetical protein